MKKVATKLNTERIHNITGTKKEMRAAKLGVR